MVTEHLGDATSAVQSLATLLDHERRPNVILQQGCERVIQVVPGADMASVTILDSHRTPTTAACTNPAVYDLNAIQYDAGEGPCIDAAARKATVRVSTAAARTQWPHYAAAAETAGVGSHLSVPLYIGTEHAGAFNLYSVDDHGFGDFDVALLDLYASSLQGIIASATRASQAYQLAEQLGEALDSRGPIDQAKGILMARHRVDADKAFALLSEQSQRDQIKVRDLARQIIDETTAT